MNRPRSQLTLALVALLLGLLVVVQLRAQTGGSSLENLSAQELTTLVANLNTRNDQLRTEIATLEGETAQLRLASSRGETSVGQLTTDLTRVRAWTGLGAVSGPGIRVTVSGPIAGSAVQDLLNELRNAGAEAIAVGDTRIVTGVVVGGDPGAVSVENTPLADPFEVDAIGSPEALTGSLTRAGGIVAQLQATFSGLQLTVTPLDRLLLAPTDRQLVPAHGTPRL
ncbi:MAG: DUF881 domain-containing protein [Candidatus Limnocylindrales bacterium]